jgi:hypothetical protein
MLPAMIPVTTAEYGAGENLRHNPACPVSR